MSTLWSFAKCVLWCMLLFFIATFALKMAGAVIGGMISLIVYAALGVCTLAALIYVAKSLKGSGGKSKR